MVSLRISDEFRTLEDFKYFTSILENKSMIPSLDEWVLHSVMGTVTFYIQVQQSNKREQTDRKRHCCFKELQIETPLCVFKHLLPLNCKLLVRNSQYC